MKNKRTNTRTPVEGGAGRKPRRMTDARIQRRRLVKKKYRDRNKDTKDKISI